MTNITQISPSGITFLPSVKDNAASSSNASIEQINPLITNDELEISAEGRELASREKRPTNTLSPTTPPPSDPGPDGFSSFAGGPADAPTPDPATDGARQSFSPIDISV